MYNTFECHFKPNKKKQRELGDPVGPCCFKDPRYQTLPEVC